MKRKHLFLDLEDTVIEPVLNGWFRTELIPSNIEKIKTIMSDFKPDFVHVFSFAVWNQTELERFNQGTREMVEQALGIKFSGVPSVDDDIIPSACAVMGICNVDFDDMSSFWGKHETFRLNVRNMFKYAKPEGLSIEVLLVDDAVMNEEFSWPDLNITGKIVDITKL